MEAIPEIELLRLLEHGDSFQDHAVNVQRVQLQAHVCTLLLLFEVLRFLVDQGALAPHIRVYFSGGYPLQFDEMLKLLRQVILLAHLSEELILWLVESLERRSRLRVEPLFRATGFGKLLVLRIDDRQRSSINGNMLRLLVEV